MLIILHFYWIYLINEVTFYWWSSDTYFSISYLWKIPKGSRLKLQVETDLSNQPPASSLHTSHTRSPTTTSRRHNWLLSCYSERLTDLWNKRSWAQVLFVFWRFRLTRGWSDRSRKWSTSSRSSSSSPSCWPSSSSPRRTTSSARTSSGCPRRSVWERPRKLSAISESFVAAVSENEAEKTETAKKVSVRCSWSSTFFFRPEIAKCRNEPTTSSGTKNGLTLKRPTRQFVD